MLVDISQRYHQEWGFNPSLATAPEMLVGTSQRQQKSSQAHGSTVVALHLEVFRVSYFPKGTFLLVVSLLDYPEKGRRDNLGEEVLLRLETLSTSNFPTTYLFQAPTHLVCQAISVYSSTPYLDVGNARDEQGCHHLSAYPSTHGTTQHMKVDPDLDTTSTKVTTTLASYRNIRLYQESSSRASVQRMNDDPTNKQW